LKNEIEMELGNFFLDTISILDERENANA